MEQINIIELLEKHFNLTTREFLEVVGFKEISIIEDNILFIDLWVEGTSYQLNIKDNEITWSEFNNER